MRSLLIRDVCGLDVLSLPFGSAPGEKRDRSDVFQCRLRIKENRQGVKKLPRRKAPARGGTGWNEGDLVLDAATVRLGGRRIDRLAGQLGGEAAVDEIDALGLGLAAARVVID